MKLLNALYGLLFSLFLLLPAGSLLLFGYDPQAEARPIPQSIEWARFTEPNDDYRNQIMRELNIGSPAGMWAIRQKSSLDYLGFGYVRTSQVISGKDGWLFYVPQFNRRMCLSDAAIARSMLGLIAMQAVADGAEMDLDFAVAPDKSTMYPERLSVHSEILSGCKLDFSRRWREIAARLKAPIIDHYAALSASPFGTEYLYYTTDTHWNDLGRALALRQLAIHYTGQQIDLSALDGFASSSKNRDLMAMLRLNRAEAAPSSSAVTGGAIFEGVATSPGHTLVLHDSFYENLHEALAKLFETVEVSVLRPAEMERTLAGTPERILAESVERSFFGRVANGPLSWSGPLGRHLLDRNAAAAAKCSLSPLDRSILGYRKVDQSQNPWVAGNDSQVLISLPQGGKPCIRIDFQGSRGTAQIFLPDIGTGRHLGGLSIDALEHDGHLSMALVLPAGYAGKTLRFDPFFAEGQISRLQVSVGTEAHEGAVR